MAFSQLHCSTTTGILSSCRDTTTYTDDSPGEGALGARPASLDEIALLDVRLAGTQAPLKALKKEAQEEDIIIQKGREVCVKAHDVLNHHEDKFGTNSGKVLSRIRVLLA